MIGEMPPHGRPDAHHHRFKACEVYAGGSVSGGRLDAVCGNVVKRETSPDGEVLTVKGAALIRKDDSICFNDEIQVLVSADTKVSRQLATAPLSIEAISVGQRVVMLGELKAPASSGFMPRVIMTVLR